ncbi:hypothetical protein ACHAWU_010182 [Discostella pseudostelligera]|uniref:Uncharacterized protein n=1 Tax=Discostella pseudostelligera TaxID=259834 RepID=A0ABD3MB85_9STRA
MPTSVLPSFQPTTSQPSTFRPTAQPTVSPTLKPTSQPTSTPTTALPSFQPTTSQPSTLRPTAQPTVSPTVKPTSQPTPQPTSTPTTALPSFQPTTSQPSTLRPTAQPTPSPTLKPTSQPTPQPTSTPTSTPTTALPSFQPTASQPSTLRPTAQPTVSPTLKPTSQPTPQPTSTPTTALPSFQPTTSQPSTLQPTAQPTVSPTLKPTIQPTFQPNTPSTQTAAAQPWSTSSSATISPVFVSLPFLGGCPAQVGEFASIHHEPGDRVSKDGIVFECKEWPASLYCSQGAFNPMPGSKTKNEEPEHWKVAWEVVGHCSGAIVLPVDGCPSAWSSGGVHKYKENDQVSVIKSNTPFARAIYKCKAWPYSWHCGQHSPLDYSGGVLGWEYVGECTGTIGPSPSPTFPPGTLIINGCPAEYNSASNSNKNYKAGDQVARADVVYECREFPYSGYCNQEGFAPGDQYDYMAWNRLGPCDGTKSPTISPMTFLGSAPCTYVKIVATTPTPTPVVTPVRVGAKKFQCKPWPLVYLFCRMPAYAPTDSETTGWWNEAWTLVGTCPP